MEKDRSRSFEITRTFLIIFVEVLYTNAALFVSQFLIEIIDKNGRVKAASCGERLKSRL